MSLDEKEKNLLRVRIKVKEGKGKHSDMIDNDESDGEGGDNANRRAGMEVYDNLRELNKGKIITDEVDRWQFWEDIK